MSRFTEALIQLLQERGISQNKLGERLGITGSAVSLWTQGKTIPTRDNVIRLEDELAVEPRGSLLKLAGYSLEDSEAPTTVESLIRADPGLAAEDKRILLRILTLARERHAQSD